MISDNLDYDRKFQKCREKQQSALIKHYLFCWCGLMLALIRSSCSRIIEVYEYSGDGEVLLKV